MKTNTRHWAGITAGILTLAGYASAATLGSEKYAYDASGNIIEKSIDGVVTKMSFDQSNRLIERQTAGQDTQTTAYDAASRPVTERNADGQTTRSMSYGYGDKVLESQSQDSKAGFYYNAEGQLVGKNVGGNVSTYTWDGNVLAAEGAEAFANEAHISGGVPVLESGKVIVISDYLGNTLASEHTQLTGTSYGEGLETARFTGKPFIEELRGYIFKYRIYSIASSRWTSSDPVGFPDGMNNQEYSGSDPINNVDPTGCNFLMLYQGLLCEYDGEGYQNGAVDLGDSIECWEAISNNSDPNIVDGSTPHGWYTVGSKKPNNEIFHDEVGTPNTIQGGMSLWSRYGTDYGTDVGSGDQRTDRTCLTSIYNGGTVSKANWSFNMGSNFINNRLKEEYGTEYYIFPSARTKSSIQMHPEGGAYGTHGCVGFVGYSNADSFRVFAEGDGAGIEVWIPGDTTEF